MMAFPLSRRKYFCYLLLLLQLGLVKASPVECYVYNSSTVDTDGSYNYKICGSFSDIKADCEQTYDSIQTSVNDQMEQLIKKELQGLGRSSSSPSTLAVGRQRPWVDNDRVYNRGQDFSCFTVAINVSVKTGGGGGEGAVEEVWKPIFLEVRGIYKGYTQEGESTECKQKKAYGVWDQDKLVARGEIFFCPCSSGYQCNSKYSRSIPELAPNLLELERKIAKDEAIFRCASSRRCCGDCNTRPGNGASPSSRRFGGIALVHLMLLLPLMKSSL